MIVGIGGVDHHRLPTLADQPELVDLLRAQLQVLHYEGVVSLSYSQLELNITPLNNVKKG